MHHSPSKSNAQTEEQAHKVLSYVAHTAFFQYLRNHYQSFKELTKPDLLVLLKSAQLLRISDERSMVISFNQSTVCVVVYGQVIAEEKAYPIGKFFIVGQVKLSLAFKEKSLLVMLHKQSIEAEMQAFEDFFFKKKLIEKLLPVDLVKFTKKQMKALTSSCDFRSSFADEEVVRVEGGELGVYLLLDGTFSIMSREGVKIGDINLDYFGQEILWEKQYDFGLVTESVECRYIFIAKDVLLTILTETNLKALKAMYCKRVVVRKEMEKSMDENIRFTRDFMKKMTLNRKATVLNPQYGQPINAIQKRIKQQLKCKNVTLSSKINNSTYFQQVPSRKYTTHHQTAPSTDLKQTLFDQSMVSHQTSFQLFQPKLYKDQKAKSESIFKRRTKSQVPEKSRDASRDAPKDERVTDKDVQNLKDLPKTLSVLLKYYESTERLKLRPRTVKVQFQRGFVPCSKERRMMTTMKLHKEIFMREYFEIKALQDKAFKTWR